MTMEEKPLMNLSVPYIGPIGQGTFVPQHMIRIQGAVPSLAYRFNINLQCGFETHPQSDIAVQVSVQFLNGYIALNSLENGIWGEQQREVNLPIKRAQTFEIILLCDFNQYQVAINGQHYCTFPQRIHYNRITHLAIDGDVSITQISYESASGDGTDSVAAVKNEDGDFEIVDSPQKSFPKKRAPQPPLYLTTPMPRKSFTTYDVSKIPPPPLNSAPDPPNASSSKDDERDIPTCIKYCSISIVSILAIIIIIAIVVIMVTKKYDEKHGTHHGDELDEKQVGELLDNILHNSTTK